MSVLRWEGTETPKLQHLRFDRHWRFGEDRYWEFRVTPKDPYLWALHALPIHLTTDTTYYGTPRVMHAKARELSNALAAAAIDAATWSHLATAIKNRRSYNDIQVDLTWSDWRRAGAAITRTASLIVRSYSQTTDLSFDCAYSLSKIRVGFQL